MIALKYAAAGIVAAITVALAVALPAEANVRRFTDAHNDTPSSVDIWSVSVDNSTSNPAKVRVVVRQDNVRLGDSLHIYFDTRKGDPGPEYVFGTAVDSEYGMSRIETWHDRHGQYIPWECGYRSKTQKAVDRTWVAVPRSCIGNPGAVRVAVKVERDYPPTSRDWARDYRSWLGWVTR